MGKMKLVKWGRLGALILLVVVMGVGYGGDCGGGSSGSKTGSGSSTPPPVTIYPPNAPTSLVANTISSSQIYLSWVDNSTNEYNFELERKTGSTDTWSLIATPYDNVTYYNNTGLSASTIYYYRVRTVGLGGNSSYSNEAWATTQDPPMTVPNAPSGLAANGVSSSQINLVWLDNSDNEDGFKIERSLTSGSGFSEIATTGVDVTNYSDIGRTPSTTYYYRVRAYNSAGNSSYSAEASATTIPLAVDDYVWVANFDSNNVTRIKKSDLTKTTIPVGVKPNGVAVDGLYVWVVNWGSATVTRIKKSDLTTTVIAVGSSPYCVAVDDTYAWVTNYGDNNVTRIKKSDLTTTAITVGTNPIGIAVDVTYVWVTNSNSNNVTRITKSDLSKSTITVGTTPTAVAVDGTYAWVTNQDSDTVTRIYKSTGSKTTITVGNGPVCVVADAIYVWVTNYIDNTVTRILRTDSSTTTITVGTSPEGVAEDATYVWVANSADNNVTRILKSSLATTLITVGTTPYSDGDMTGYSYDNYNNQ